MRKVSNYQAQEACRSRLALTSAPNAVALRMEHEGKFYPTHLRLLGEAVMR